MKNLFALSLFFLVAIAVHAQPTISCPSVNGGSDTILPGPGCVQLQASVTGGFETTNYNASQIPYNPYPYNVGNQILVNIDDIWSSAIALPFTFCFYGIPYTSVAVGSNGCISFNPAYAGNFMQWAINTGIPGNTDILNSICAPFHDIDPSVSGTIRWNLVGTAPCRVFVVSWENCAMFSCTNLQSTQQIAIYETTNMIETYIQNKPLCATWNSGKAIHGIQNAAGNAAVVVPGRNNPSTWSVTNDAWRFAPSGNPAYTFNWYALGNPTPITSTDTMTVCPTLCNEAYVAELIYTNCDSTTITVLDTVNVGIQNQNMALNPSVSPVLCNGDSSGTINTNMVGGFGGYSYAWSPNIGATANINNVPAGSYTVTVTDTGGCVLVDSVTITQPPALQDTFTVSDVLCNGGNTGAIAVSVSGGTPSYSYNWSPQGSGSSTNNLPAGAYTVIVSDSNGCADTLNPVVNQPPPISTSTSTIPVTCHGGNDGTAIANSSGGTGSFTYQWFPSGLIGDTVSVLIAGQQTVVATDSFGCTDTATVTITEPSPMVISLSSTDVTCNGGSDGTASANVSGATGPFTYSWNPAGGTNPNATNLTAGVYTCIVTDANGCVDSASIVIQEPSPVSAVAFSQNETCAGLCDGSVGVTASGGNGPYTYQWNTPNNDITSTVNQLCGGTYSVTVTDASGCTATGQTTVGVNPPPVADAGADVAFCEGAGGAQLQGSASGGSGAPYYYTWTCASPPCGLSCINCPNPIANPTNTQTYYLIVTDRNGCQSPPDSVVVTVHPKPIVDAGPDVAICQPPAPCVVLTPTILQGQGPFTYQWIPGTGLNNSTIANPCARPDTSTIYALVVTDLATGCTSEFNTLDTVSTVLVEVSPIPVAEAGPDRIVCKGDSTMLQGQATDAGPGYTYQWTPSTGLSNPNIANPMASPSQTTDYSLVSYSNGCPSIADTVTVFVTEIPTVDAGQDRDVCAGDSAFLDGAASVVSAVIPDGIATFYWSPGAALADSTSEDTWAAPLATTQYTLTATSQYGCTNTDSVLLTINPSPVVDAGPNRTVCKGTQPWNLNGVIDWYGGIQPNDLNNTVINWQPVSHIIGPNNVENIEIDTDSTMWFYFTVTYNTCTHTDSVLVTVLEEILATVEVDTSVICEGDSVRMIASGGLGGGNYSWTPTDGLSNPNSSTTMAAPDSTTVYTVTISEFGCEGSASDTVNVIPSPDMAFVNSRPDGCAPFEISLSSISGDAPFLIWDMGDGSQVQNTQDVLHTYDEPGTYNVNLYGVNTGGCMDSATTSVITVHEPINAAWHSDPEAPVEFMIPGSNVNFFDDSESSMSWVWDFGNGASSEAQNPSFTYSQPGEYMVTLTVENEHGCVSTITHGPYIVLLPELFIPNVFSPNDDNINDRFLVEYSGNQPFLMTVFDRWGVQVYQTRNKNQGWTGTGENGEVPAGVYYYTVRVGDREFTGNVTLVR